MGLLGECHDKEKHHALNTGMYSIHTCFLNQHAAFTLSFFFKMPVPIESTSPCQTSSHFKGVSHVTFYVGNAKQAAAYYKSCMGFKQIAIKSFESGSTYVASHVISNGKATFVFQSAVRNPASMLPEESDEDKAEVVEISEHVYRHGDGVKDIAFEVDDIFTVYNIALRHGAIPIREVTEISDKYGSVYAATIAAYGDTTHTLIQKHPNYIGPFLPGYQFPEKGEDRLNYLLPAVNIVSIDHIVGNQDWNSMEKTCKFYEDTFGFHRFWSADDSVICTEYSALCSVVMASPENLIKIPINEPAKGKGKSQIEEFVEFYDGPGVQHIALLTDNIITTVANMKARGVEFITVPSKYYENLRKRLQVRTKDSCPIKESVNELKEHGILADFDEKGYLLQLFTQPLQDRPTMFIEVIQREGHDGFGAGNFKALFEAMEQEQRKRGTL